MDEENKIIEFPEENIIMEFSIDGDDYAVIAEDLTAEELNINFVEVEIIDGVKYARSIEDDEEFAKVHAKYEELLNTVEEVE